MLQSEIKTLTYPNGEFQRVHIVRAESFDGIDFFRPEPADNVFAKICHIYEKFIVPAAPYIFSQLVLFYLPDDVIPPKDGGRYGRLDENTALAASVLRAGVRIRPNGRPGFLTQKAKDLWAALEERGCVRLVRGLRPDTVILPVCHGFGYMTQTEETAALKVNSSFFVMDRFDCASVYDSIGTPVGLSVKNGRILTPPMFGREALVVYRGGRVAVTRPQLRDLTVTVEGREYRHGENAFLFVRPERRVTTRGKGIDIVIIGGRVAAVKKGGGTVIPAGGFVLRPFDGFIPAPRETVTYSGLEDVAFAVQVGNSTVIDGAETEKLISPFCNIKDPFKVLFPPSLYPLDYKGARAPRMAVGADRDGKPVFVWAEGASKNGYRFGKESCGASLSEMTHICREAGMVSGVNLDGGGSAQILLGNVRSLMISDRNPDDTETERPVPAGIIIR